MMARGFKPVGWVAAVGGAALSCYMLSLSVAAERAELASLERRVVAARQDIRSLQTELGTRGRLSQLEQWNAEVLALSSPSSAQYLENEVMLARFDQRQQTIEERAKVQLATAPAPAPAVTPRVVLAAAVPTPPATPLVRRAALVVDEPAQPLVRKATLVVAAPAPAKATPKPAAKRTSSALLGSDLVAEIGAAARSEAGKKSEGAGGN